MRKTIACLLPYFCMAALLYCTWEGRDKTHALRSIKFVEPDGSAIEIVVRGYKIDPSAPRPHHHSATSANPQTSGSQ